MKSILDPSFRYVPAASTDVRKTFARVRREMQKAGAPSERSPVGDGPRILVFPRSKEVASHG